MKPSRRSDIAPFYVMEVMKAAAERQRAGGDVVHLEVGQPSTPAPSVVRKAARRWLEDDRLAYTHAAGDDRLRARIARHYGEAYGVEVAADQVVVTVGASGGFVLALLAAFDAGDRIGITEPGYAAYRNIIEALGLVLVGIRVGPETRYVPTAESVAAAGPLDGLVLASPSNPTGTTLTEAELAAVTGYCAENGIRLISDEIYHGITYEEPAPTAAGSGALIVQSFSKYFSMTGWRLGWLVAPDDLVRPLERLAQNLVIAAPTLSQLAAVEAFDARAELDANVARYAVNRRVLVDGLESMGITAIAPPDGAFYVWADVSHLAVDSQELCAAWLAGLGVAVTPGIDFDPEAGNRFVRFSYSESTADIVEAVDRLRDWSAGAREVRGT